MALQNMTWESVIQAIATMYNIDSSEVTRVLDACEIKTGDVEGAFKLLEGTVYEIWYNNDGTVREYSYTGVPEWYAKSKQSSDISHLINSNTKASTKIATKAPLNTTVDQQTGNVKFEMGAKAAVGGATVTGLTKLKKYLPAAVLLASTATQMGLQLNPEYWTTHTTDPILSNLKDIDPETYEQITIRNKEISETYPGKELFDGMIKTFTDSQTGESKGEMFIDQLAQAYMIKSMINAGAFDINQTGTEVDDEVVIQNETVSDYFDLPLVAGKTITGQFASTSNITTTEILQSGAYWLVYNNGEFGPYPDSTYSGILCSDSPDVLVHETTRDRQTGEIIEDDTYTLSLMREYTYGNLTVYYNFFYNNYSVTSDSPIQNTKKEFPGTSNSNNMLAWNIVYGGDPIQGSGVEGIGVQSGATVPSFTSDMSLSDIINLLDQAFPDMANKKIVQQVVQPDGTVKEYTYVPTPMPNPNPNPATGTDPWEKPVTGEATQNDTEIVADPDEDPDNPTNPITQYIIQQITSEPEPTQENTGSGSTPPIVLPTGSAKALFRIWNPTQSEIDNLGAWLWSSQFIDQLLKMFSNPMEAIISLHKVFVSPTIGGRDDITIGYLNSGVNSNYVSGQYVTVNCGSVSLSEFYQNVFDYPPFTEVSLYLPFVGIVKLDTSDVMRGSVNVVYHVDVVTGACLAEVNVIRDSSGGIIYTYTGNCAVQYPLSSGSYMGVVTSAVGLAAGAAATFMTGGGAATIPYLLRHGTGALSSAKTSVQRSGSFSANAGAMGCKKPYFIISRPQSNLANNFNMFVGKPANFTTKIGACTGFVSCIEVHIENCNGTDAELAELENLLKAGIII